MAKGYKNEILEEQRKAQKEFLELKKMQHGEMVPDKGSQPIIPSTPSEKIANFWFQYKWHTIAAVAAAVIIIVSLVQYINRTVYDFEVVLFSYTPMTEQQVSLLRSELEDRSDDVNGDGEVHVSLVNCSYASDNKDGQYEYAMLNKLQATLAADYDALLFITDEQSYKYLMSLEGMEGVFESDPAPLSDAFLEEYSEKGGKGAELPDGLQISCRTVKGTNLEGKKNMDGIYKQSKSVMKSLTD